jgi:hypothetical protein
MLTVQTKKNLWRWVPVNLVGLVLIVCGIAGFSRHLFKLNSRSWSAARHSVEFSVAGDPNLVPMVVGAVVVLAGLGLAILSCRRMRFGKYFVIPLVVLFAWSLIGATSLQVSGKRIREERSDEIDREAQRIVNEYLNSQKPVPRQTAWPIQQDRPTK